MSYDKVIKVFSADGHIYQMEYAFKAVQMFGDTSIAVKGLDSVVVCSQKKIPDKLIVPSSKTNIFNISDTVGAIMVGNMNDAKTVVFQLRNFSSQFKFKFGYEMPVHVMAQKLGNELQKYSQYAGMRPFCVSTTLVGIDEERGPQCFRIDPAGQSIGYAAVSQGSKE